MKTKQGNLYQQRKAALKEANGIIDGIKAEGRDMTKAENQRLDGIMSNVKSIDGQIERHEKSTRVINDMTDAYQQSGGKSGPTQPFDGSKHIENLSAALNAKQSYGLDVDHHHVKSLTTGNVDPLGSYAQGDNLVHSNPGTAVTSLRSLFAQEQAPSGLIRYYRIGYSGADVVAEGERKPEGLVETEAVNAELKKIATQFPVSDELTEDAPLLFDSITTEAAAEVLRRENQLIVETLAETPGIATASTTADNLIDAVADAIAEREADVGVQPGALVLSPRDFAILRKARATGSGQHLVNPFNESPATLFGMHLFPSNALEAGTAYAVSAGSGVFYYRGGLRIEAGFSGEDWIHNLITVRAEERVLPAIVQPKRITRITIGDAATE